MYCCPLFDSGHPIPALIVALLPPYHMFPLVFVDILHQGLGNFLHSL